MHGVRRLNTWQGFGLALGLTALAALGVWAIEGVVGPIASLLFALPVLAAAWYGGFGPGALATILSALALAYLALPPLRTLAFTPSNPGLLQLGLFGLVMALLTGLSARRGQMDAHARRQAARWQALAQATHAFAAAGPGTLAILEAVTRELTATINESFVLQLLSDDGEWLNTVSAYHPDGEAQDALREVYASPQRASDGLAGQVLKTGAPACLPNVSPEQLRAGVRPRHWPALERFDGSSVLVLPLRSRGHALGVITTLRAPRQPAHGADDLAWWQSLAERAAQVLDTARLREAEEAARQKAEAAAAEARQLQALSAALAGAQTVEQVARALNDLVLPRLGATDGALALLAPGHTADHERALEVVPLNSAAQAPTAESPAYEPQRQPLAEGGPLAEALREGSALWLRAPEELRARFPTLAPAHTQHWTGALAALPLAVDGHTLGAVLVARPEPGEWSEPDRRFLQAASLQCAHTLQRVRLYWTEAAARQAAEASLERLGRLEAAAAGLAAALDWEPTLDAVLREGMAAAGADTGAVSILAPGSQQMVLCRSAGYPELAAHDLASLALDGPAPEASAVRTRAPLTLAARSAVPSRYPHLARAYASLRCEALAVIPLISGDRVYGTLTLGFGHSRQFAQADHDFLNALAALCGHALARAEQHAAEKAARQSAEAAQAREAFVAEASTRLASSLDVADTLAAVAQLAAPRLAGLSLAYALDGSGRVCASAHAADAEREPLLAALREQLALMPERAGLLAREVLQPGRPLLIPEVSDSMLAALPEEDGLRQRVVELEPRALLVIPLAVDGTTLGGLVLCAAGAEARFSPDTQTLAQALAVRAARAIQHALRHAKAQSHNAELEQVVNKRTEELQATILRLEAEIAERERAQSALEVSREQLRSLSARLQATREEERARIAREVHDDLGQQLTSIKMDIAWLRKKLREQQEPLLKKTRAMAELIDTTVQSVRRITQELRPGILDDFGLLAAIEWQVQEFQTRTGIECQLISYVDDVRLDTESATAVFRVFQETLTNVARHANATRVEVTLERQGDWLVLQVEDNGRGITDRELHGASSLGLLGMRERIHLLAGEIDIRGIPNEGTIVLVKVPLPEPAPREPTSPSDAEYAQIDSSQN